jgi:Carboxypeptidase regulatory-like domain
MHRRTFLSSVVLLAIFGLVLGTALSPAQDSSNKRGRKYKSPPPTAKIEVTIVKDANGKPIENAAVVFHTLNDPGNMELKSNEEGKAMIDVLQMGETVRLQIIAKGYQTYGRDYKIDKDQMAIEVRMKRPGEQYSVYKAHPENETTDADENKKQEQKPNSDAKPQ